MKTFLASMMLVSASAIAQQATPQTADTNAPSQEAPQEAPKPAPEHSLKEGSDVNLAAVAQAEWLQGEAPKSFEPDKIYIFECWATWCGPCMKLIPHMNGLYKKYHDKGLEIFGMNIWDKDKEKVEKFVKSKGDEMSYPVAFNARGSAFEKDWLKAAGVNGIPHAFVVKQGKLVLNINAAELSEEVIQNLLSGEDGVAKANDTINAMRAKMQKIEEDLKDIYMTGLKGDAETMAAKIAEFKKDNPDDPNLPTMDLNLLITRKDWPAATEAVAKLPSDPEILIPALSMLVNRVAGMPDDFCPAEFAKLVASTWTKASETVKLPPNPVLATMLSMVHWKAGDQEAAKASAKKAAEVATKHPGKKSQPVEPFVRFANEVDGGKMPTMKEFSGWMNEAAQKSAGVRTLTPKPKPSPEATPDTPKEAK